VVEQQAALEREARRKSASGLVARVSLEALTLYARSVAASSELADLRASLERSKRLTEMAKALVQAPDAPGLLDRYGLVCFTLGQTGAAHEPTPSRSTPNIWPSALPWMSLTSSS
jgi:hypothetical protein